MTDLAVLQAGVEVGYDVVVGSGGFDYPWGDSAADEAFVYVLWDLGRRVIAAWREERQEARVESTLDRAE
jgi:hypothetical protein